MSVEDGAGDQRGDLVRQWHGQVDGRDVSLSLYDLGTRDPQTGHHRMGYRFWHGTEMVFTGDDYAVPAHHAVDSDDAVRGLLGFLSLRPGDTDAEYFDSYTRRQRQWADQHGEELALYTDPEQVLAGEGERRRWTPLTTSSAPCITQLDAPAAASSTSSTPCARPGSTPRPSTTSPPSLTPPTPSSPPARPRSPGSSNDTAICTKPSTPPDTQQTPTGTGTDPGPLRRESTVTKARSVRQLVRQAQRNKSSAHHGRARSSGSGGTRRGRDASVRLAEALVDLQDQRSRPPARTIRLARSASWKFRRQLAPLAIIACTWLAGELAHGARVQLVLVLLVFAGAVAWLFTRKWLDEHRERVYAAVVTVAVLAWLLVATLRGVEPPMPAVLVGSGCLLAMPWWWRHRFRNTMLEEPDSSPVDVWTERVASTGKALPGSWLSDVQRIECGWRGRIRLVAGDKSTDDAVASTLRIASAYEKPAPQVIVEPTTDGIASHAQLTVLDRNPLRHTRPWAGPSFDLATGLFDLGVYADADIARFEFAEPGWGAKHALVVGTTGSGKTNTVNTILTEAHMSRLIVVWLIDPQLGQSLPAWNAHVDWTALGVEQAMVMLRCFKTVMMARSAHMATLEWTDDKGRPRVGKDHYTLNPVMPLHYLVLEEAHQLLTHPTYGPEAVKLLEDAGKMGRKTGSGICLINQMPGLEELGGSQTLRSMVSSGNVVVHRTSDRVTTGMAFSGAMPVEPNKLPRKFPDGSSTHGLGYLLGAAARQAAMRTYLVDDPYGIATSLPALPLDPASANAAGEVYARRHDPAAIAAATEALAESRATPSIAPAAAGERTTPLARQILCYLRGRGDVDRGRLIKHTAASPRGVANALNTLLADGLVTKVSHGVYRATDTEEAQT